MTFRSEFARAAASRRDQVVEVARRLVAVASSNPPGDTNAVAKEAAAILRELIPDVALSFHPGSAAIANIVARVHGVRQGRRVVFNGHLDTYPIGDLAAWTTDPAGTVRDGRLYGRGSADMKGGIAASIVALALLAEYRDFWQGEAVLTLAGDEETMGVLGTQHLIATVPHAIGDAVIVGDAGSPHVLRFGEKGFLWIEIEAAGRAAHGAHVHLGINALDRLRAALDALVSLRDLPIAAPPNVTRAIAAAKPISEALNGVGEAEVLSSITVNIGRMEGGTSMNLVPAYAKGYADIRLPVGVTTTVAETALAATLSDHEGISWRIVRRVEPNYTDPDTEIVRCCVATATEVLGKAPAVNMRVGGSDARLYRAVGCPTIVYGPTPHNMGGPDEWVDVEELDVVAQVHALTALDYLAQT